MIVGVHRVAGGAENLRDSPVTGRVLGRAVRDLDNRSGRLALSLPAVHEDLGAVRRLEHERRFVHVAPPLAAERRVESRAAGRGVIVTRNAAGHAVTRARDEVRSAWHHATSPGRLHGVHAGDRIMPGGGLSLTVRVYGTTLGN